MTLSLFNILPLTNVAHLEKKKEKKAKRETLFVEVKVNHTNYDKQQQRLRFCVVVRILPQDDKTFHDGGQGEEFFCGQLRPLPVR